MSEGNLVELENSLPVMANPHMRLIEVAVSNGTDISQLEKLMDLQERYESNMAKKSFNLSMSQFQSELPIIEKLGVVDYTTDKGRTYYRYAKIEDIAKAIQPALKSSGLSYRFKQQQENGVIIVECIVTHKDGHSESSELFSSPDTSGRKDALKSIASAISYLRRYTLTGLLGIVVGGEDDDAEGHQMPSEQGQTDQVQCYPDEEFKKNFPVWAKKITDGKHTVDSLHKFLTKKNIILSQDQYSKLQSVK